jgi:hypothetical protein
VVIEVLPEGEDMIFDLFGFTTNAMGSQDKKENQ